MGSITMDAFINKFLDMLHYVPYIKDEKVKIQQFLRFLPPNFQERIEFDMPKTLEATLHKARFFYEHGKPRQENMNKKEIGLRTSLTTTKQVLTHSRTGNITTIFQQTRNSTNQVQNHMYQLQMLTIQ